MLNQFNPHIRNQLSLNNYEVLHKHLLKMSWRQQLAIQLRFWEEYSIHQVATTMNITWMEADRLIELAISNLKSGLLTSSTQTPTSSAA